jgi:conjugal transfer/entry exclusion protein
MPDGTSIADQVANNADRVEQMRQRMKRFSDTSQPGTGAWTVGTYGDALPPKSY